MKASEKIRSRLLLDLASRGIEIPAWVPKDLEIEFADCAINHDEHRAAAYIRKIKSERESVPRAIGG